MQTITDNSIKQINSALFSLKNEVSNQKSTTNEIKEITKEVSKTIVQISADLSNVASKSELSLEKEQRINADEELSNRFSNYITNYEKGIPEGIATLDESGRIPFSQLPESAMEFKGKWNAETNTPTITQGEGTNGDFYIVNVGGIWEGVSFLPNDRIIFDGSTNTWDKLPAGEVSSVNGQSGDVELDIPTKTSDLNNDSDFVSDSNYVHTDNNFTDILKNKLDGLSGGVSSVNGKTGEVQIDIPSKTSDLVNDSNYITKENIYETITVPSNKELVIYSDTITTGKFKALTILSYTASVAEIILSYTSKTNIVPYLSTYGIGSEPDTINSKYTYRKETADGITKVIISSTVSNTYLLYPYFNYEIQNKTSETYTTLNSTYYGVYLSTVAVKDIHGNSIATTYAKKTDVNPTGTILSFAGSTTPSGYLFCNGQAISRTTYSALFSVIGTTYGTGDGTTTFNVPDLRSRFIEGATGSDVGTKIEAGLPNIKAQVSCESEGLFNGRGTMTATGGFSLSNNTSWAGGDNNVGGRPRTLSFDASLGTYNKSGTLMSQTNSPFGKSDTVQPPALKLNYIIKY